MGISDNASTRYLAAQVKFDSGINVWQGLGMNNRIPPLKIRFVWFLISFFPLLILAGQVALFFVHWAVGLAGLYLAPPLISKVILMAFKVKPGRYSAKSKEFFGWYLSNQFQILFMRFPLFEEILRLVPRLYSFWLRLWGSQIGKAVTWSPGVIVVDRPFVEIGDYAIIGMLARLGSHHFNSLPNGEFELLIGTPKVGVRSVMGGESGLGPGAILSDYEMLPATLALAPGYIWEKGRRRANSYSQSTNESFNHSQSPSIEQ